MRSFCGVMLSGLRAIVNPGELGASKAPFVCSISYRNAQPLPPQAGEETIGPCFSLRLRGEYVRREAAAREGGLHHCVPATQVRATLAR